MSSEYYYLQQIISHESWHINQEGESPIDLSCGRCFPVDINKISTEFNHFWKHCIELRGIESNYSASTLVLFEQIRNQRDNSKVKNQIQQLLETLRYT